MQPSQQDKPQTSSKLIKVYKKLSLARLHIEDYLEDCALFVGAVPVANPLETLNSVLNGASNISLGDMRKAAGQACEVACSACKPLIDKPSYGSYGSYGSSYGSDTQRVEAMAKAFSAIATQGV